MSLRVRAKDGKATLIPEPGLCEILQMGTVLPYQCPEPIFSDSPNSDPESFGGGKKVCKKHYDMIVEDMGGVQ